MRAKFALPQSAAPLLCRQPLRVPLGGCRSSQGSPNLVVGRTRDRDFEAAGTEAKVLNQRVHFWWVSEGVWSGRRIKTRSKMWRKGRTAQSPSQLITSGSREKISTKRIRDCKMRINVAMDEPTVCRVSDRPWNTHQTMLSRAHDSSSS